MKFPLWFNAAIHSAVLHSLRLHTQSPSFKNSASLSLPQHQIFLNLYHNASFKIFLYVLHLHLYPSLATVRLPFELPIWAPFILPVRLALHLSHCFKGSCLHFCLRGQGRPKKASSTSSRMRLLIWPWFTPPDLVHIPLLRTIKFSR